MESKRANLIEHIVEACNLILLVLLQQKFNYDLTTLRQSYSKVHSHIILHKPVQRESVGNTESLFWVVVVRKSVITTMIKHS